MNLWLDDYRKCPFVGNWVTVKNYDEAIEALKKHKIEEAWLDHDLADEHYSSDGTSEYKEKTGYDVVLWMEQNDVWPDWCMVHSMNPEGANRMCKVLAKQYGTSNNPRIHYMNYLKLKVLIDKGEW
jgi:hypothetical protein